MLVSAGIRLLLLLAIGVSCVLARPGAPSYPSEEENIIPDYAYDNEEDNGKSELVGGWKSIPVPSPDKVYDMEMPETTALGENIETEITSSTSATTAAESTPEATSEAIPKEKAVEVAGAVRAVEVAGSAGAAAAVHAVEVVEAAFGTTEVPDGTTTFAVESGRSLGSGTFRDEKAMGDAPAPTPTVDQSLYGFSKFLHDLLQVPVQVMRSVSSYLSGAFNGRHDAAGAPITRPHDHGLASAMLSQSF